jgi:hypothetical protein
MGNTNKKLLQQLAELNLICSSKRFREISGFKLNFTLLANSSKIQNFLPINEKIQSIQVSSLSENDKLQSLIGTTSILNFNKIYNIIYHLISFSVCSNLEEDEICAICLDNPSDVVLDCGHQFCSKDLES